MEHLLVNDERNALRALNALLEGEGFRVRTADETSPRDAGVGVDRNSGSIAQAVA